MRTVEIGRLSGRVRAGIGAELRQRRRAWAPPIASSVALLILASPAFGSYDPIDSGMATLKLAPKFERVLESHHFQLVGRGGVSVQRSGVRFPVSGGKADPTIKKADVEAEGELLIRGPRGAVALKDVSFFTKPTPLIAKLGGGQLKIARSRQVTLVREGFGNALRARDLRLTEKAAKRIDKRLHTDAFVDAQPLGRLQLSSQPASLAILPQGMARLDFDPNLFAELKKDSTSVNPIFPAEHSDLAYSFPIIAGGRIAPDGSSGTLRIGGSLEFLRLGAGQIFWNEPWFDLAASSVSVELDLEPTPSQPGSLGRTAVVDATAGPIATDPSSRTITLSGVPLSLNGTTADQFDKAFAEGESHYGAGEALGLLTVTIQAQ